MNPDRFGYAVIPFKLAGSLEPRNDIPKWKIARSNARSMGKTTTCIPRNQNAVNLLLDVFMTILVLNAIKENRNE